MMIEDLDLQITKARAQWTEVRIMANYGCKISQLLVRRMESVREDVLAAYTKGHFAMVSSDGVKSISPEEFFKS